MATTKQAAKATSTNDDAAQAAPKVKRELTKPERMKEALDKQKKKEVFIPLEGKEPVGAVETVIINGYRFDIMKGVKVEVPEQVADILHDSMYQTQKAHQEAIQRAGKAENL